MNIASTKERILQFIDYKEIKISNFLRETGIKRGFLDADKLNVAVTDFHLAIIIAIYPSLNLIWLVTGEGEMILNNVREPSTSSPDSKMVDALNKIISAQELTITAQTKTILTLETSSEDQKALIRSLNQTITLQSNLIKSSGVETPDIPVTTTGAMAK